MVVTFEPIQECMGYISEWSNKLLLITNFTFLFTDSKLSADGGNAVSKYLKRTTCTMDYRELLIKNNEQTSSS